MIESVDAPVLDLLLQDSMAFPVGVGSWLREREAAGRRLQRRVASLDPNTAIRLLRTAGADLGRLLDDPQLGVLARLLRRPRHQLAAGSAVLAAFQRHSEMVYGRTENALTVQEGAEKVRHAVALLRSEFDALLPNLAGSEIAAARATPEDVDGLTSAHDAERAVKRLQRAALGLSRIVQARSGVARDASEMSDDAGVTIDELFAALSTRVAEREAVAWHRGGLREMHRLVDRHDRALSRIANDPEPSTTDRFTAGLVSEVRRAERRRQHRVDDLPFRLASTARLAAGLSAILCAPGWLAPLPATEVTPSVEEAGASSIMYVVAIGYEYVCLTQAYVSAVRVSGLGEYRPGAELAVRAFAGADPDTPQHLALLDLAPCFDGIVRGTAGWYQMPRRGTARIRLIARSGDTWFGKIVAKGTLERLAQPAWNDAVPSAGAIRIFDERASGLTSAIQVGWGGQGGQPNCGGFETREVATPLSEDVIGWFRSGGDRLKWTRNRLIAEWAFFSDFTRVAAFGLTALGEARLGPAFGFLYRLPSAFLPDASPAADEWLTATLSDRIATLRAVARVVMSVHSTDHALGLCHRSAFAFSPSWPRSAISNADPVSRAHLVYAPFITPRGKSFPAVPASSAFNRLEFAKLRYQGLPSPIGEKLEATPAADAVGFWLYALDHLLKRPLAADGVWFGWNDLAAAIERGAAQFEAATLVHYVAPLLADADSWPHLLRMMEALADGADWTSIQALP